MPITSAAARCASRGVLVVKYQFDRLRAVGSRCALAAPPRLRPAQTDAAPCHGVLNSPRGCSLLMRALKGGGVGRSSPLVVRVERLSLGGHRPRNVQ